MLKLIFVNLLGRNYEGIYTYEFYFKDGDLEGFWIENSEVKPAYISGIKTPPVESFDDVKILRTNSKLNMAQNNSSFSMQDCYNGVISLVWESLDELDEYPENGRIVFKFGEELLQVERFLGSRDMFFDNKDDEPIF